MGLRALTGGVMESVRTWARSFVFLLLLLAPAGPAQALEREDFIQANLCEVMLRFWTIHEHPSATNRFLVVSVKGHPQSYVQCLLLDHDASILCEAASGVSGPRRRLELEPGQVRTLTDQGFTQGGSAGNFQRQRPLSDDVETELVDTSAMLLGALYDIYGARNVPDLVFSAPLAAPFGYFPAGCRLMN